MTYTLHILFLTEIPLEKCICLNIAYHVDFVWKLKLEFSFQDGMTYIRKLINFSEKTQSIFVLYLVKWINVNELSFYSKKGKLFQFITNKFCSNLVLSLWVKMIPRLLSLLSRWISFFSVTPAKETREFLGILARWISLW